MTRNHDGECDRIAAILAEYSAGGLSHGTRANVEAHLLKCTGCAKEYRALQHTALLLSQVPLETAPDLWASIRPSLSPRPVDQRRGLTDWLAMHRMRSAVAAATATAAIAMIAFLGHHPQAPTPPAPTRSDYYASYTYMNWDEPFADKAGLGMSSDVPVDAASEAAQ